MLEIPLDWQANIAKLNIDTHMTKSTKLSLAVHGSDKTADL